MLRPDPLEHDLARPGRQHFARSLHDTSTTFAPSSPSSCRSSSPWACARFSSHVGTEATATANGSTTSASRQSIVARAMSTNTGTTSAATMGGAMCDVKTSNSSTSAMDARAMSPERRFNR